MQYLIIWSCSVISSVALKSLSIAFSLYLTIFLSIQSLAASQEHVSSVESNKKIIYIYPGSWGDLFAFDNPVANRDNSLEPIYKLKQEAAKQGFELRQTRLLKNLKNFEYLLLFEVPLANLDDISEYPKEKLILFLWEPPSVSPENYIPENHRYFSKIFTWNDDLVDGEKYFKFYYPVQHSMISDLVSFDKKKLSTLIVCNKVSSHPNELYSERAKLIRFYEGINPNYFDLYGKWWPSSIKNYRGEVYRKVDVLKHYKFSYAYENIRGIPGYVTEKIFDCLEAGTVPIYWGAPNIHEYVPRNCYISREDFTSNADLLGYLLAIDEQSYSKYMDNIRLFLNSPEAKLYSADNFVRICMDAINPPLKN